jgi:hypothetical protein
VQSYTDSYTQIVDVYKSMGGGCVDLADAATATGREPPVSERSQRQPRF